MDINGKVALVTGAGSGIGRATALRLAGEGAAVAAADRNLAGAEETAHLVAAAGGRALAIACDVAESAAVAAAAAHVAEALGPAEVLANVAGIGDTAGLEGIETIDDARWRLVLAVNLSGAFYWCRALLPGMAARGRALECLTIPDRAEAIERAIRGAQPGDLVLIAGKGHEKNQVIGDRVLPFDDVEAARAALARRRAGATVQ